MRALNLYLDDKPGWRRYLVLSEGRIWTKVINLEDAQSHKLRTKGSSFDAGDEIPLQPRRMAKRLRKVAVAYGRENSAGVKLALKMLKEARS